MKDAHDDLDEHFTHEGLQCLDANSTTPASRNIFDSAKSKGKKVKFTISLINTRDELWIQRDKKYNTTSIKHSH